MRPGMVGASEENSAYTHRREGHRAPGPCCRRRPSDRIGVSGTQLDRTRRNAQAGGLGRAASRPCRKRVVSQSAAGRLAARLWTHNDSGEAVIFALDANGSVTGSVRVSGARVGDWEAMAVGPCGAGSCLFIADIGDNEANRDRITIYRVPEPRSGKRIRRPGCRDLSRDVSRRTAATPRR